MINQCVLEKHVTWPTVAKGLLARTSLTEVPNGILFYSIKWGKKIKGLSWCPLQRWCPLNTCFTVKNQPMKWEKIPEEMGPSLSVVVSSNALCSFSWIPGLPLPICFPTDLVIAAACSWISFPARNEKQICYVIFYSACNPIGSRSGRNFLIRTATVGGIRRVDLFFERISGFRPFYTSIDD